MIAKCPRCGKEADTTENPFRPFCGERCKLLDLGNWITGAYHIASDEDSEEDGGESPPQKDPE